MRLPIECIHIEFNIINYMVMYIIYTHYTVHTSLYFKAAVFPIQILRQRHPKDHMSTAVVYNVSYGPDISI